MIKFYSRLLLSLTAMMVLSGLTDKAQANDINVEYYCRGTNNSSVTYAVIVQNNKLQPWQTSPELQQSPSVFELRGGQTDLGAWRGLETLQRGVLSVVTVGDKNAWPMGVLNHYIISFNKKGYYLTLRNNEGSVFICSTMQSELFFQVSQ